MDYEVNNVLWVILYCAWLQKPERWFFSSLLMNFYWYTNKVLLFHLLGDVQDLVKVDFLDWFFRLKRSTYTSQNMVLMICIVGVNSVLARTMNSRNLSGLYVLLCLRIRLGTKTLLQRPSTKICHIQLFSFTCIHN